MNKRDKVIAGLIAAVVMAVVVLQFGMYKGRTQSAEASVRTSDQAVTDLLKQQLNEARFDAEVEREKLSIIICESGAVHHDVWGDGGRSYGIAQFQQRTFNWMRGLAGRPELQWKNRTDQLWLLDWALRNGYGKDWTCYSRRGES